MKSLHSLDPVKQAFPHGPQAQNWYTPFIVATGTFLRSACVVTDRLSSRSNDTNLFLSRHPNGAMPGAVQDAPLALITKPRSQGLRPPQSCPSPPYPMPINLSTSSKDSSGSSSSPVKPQQPRKSRNPKPLSLSKAVSPAHAVRSRESDLLSSKDSDDSLGDDYDDEDDMEDDDSGSSLSGRCDFIETPFHITLLLI